jgi:hypothetical protein
MKFHRIIIAIQLNTKMFRLSSLSGQLIDDMLNLRNTEKDISDDYFTKVSTSPNLDDMQVSLTNEDNSHELIFQSSQVILRTTALNDGTLVSTERAYKEFELFWKKADKLMHFPAVRRIGFVAEFRAEEKTKNSSSNDLMKALLKSDKNNHSGRFHLQYEDHSLKDNGEIPNASIDDYWNTIYTYYASERDETPEKDKINANIDIQKYYAPAKSGALAELRKVKERFTKEKTKFKKSLLDMGFE